MDFSRFFVDRPIFAAVLSILIFVGGLIAIPQLPISEYPDVVPPSVQVRAVYPGANPKTIAETVAAPLEEAITGVENMIYMKSVAGSDGVMSLTVTFKTGTDIDLAQVQVQNRVSQATPRLPEDVRRLGVSTLKQSPNLTMVVHLLSPKGGYDVTYLRNYAVLHVKDELARIPGVGQALIFGAGDYSMRVWLQPDRVAALGLTAGDVVRAIQEQNVQVSAGAVGAPPQKTAADFTLSINAQGRLVTEEEFENVVVKSDGGNLTRLKDIARVELGASEYALRSLLNNQQAVAIPIFQAPGSNAIAMSDAVREKMKELATRFPEDVSWTVVYDPTVFVRDSIKAVITTLFEAIALVVFVVILFLQTWRASIIPLLAVPVSIVGTFAVLWLLGFSINVLTLFGLVLAIGIVVDDAIVVVENVERNIEAGLKPLAAAHKAMGEVSGPIIAIALVLCAVFVPMAFIGGVTGQFYRQFAVTIAISTVISAINSLTLSPALAAGLLKPHDAPADWLTRTMDRLFGGWLFRPFNRLFQRAGDRYAEGGRPALRRAPLMLLVYAVLIVFTVIGFRAVPGGFIPTQDKLYLFAGAKLPEGASLDRTEKMIRRMSEIAKETRGVKDAVAFPGLNALQFTNTPNMGTIFFGLQSFDERAECMHGMLYKVYAAVVHPQPKPECTAEGIAQALTGRFLGEIKEGLGFAFMPPPILGLGNAAGYEMYIQDKAGLGYGELNNQAQMLMGRIMSTPGFERPISSYQSNVPQLSAEVDRTKAKEQGIGLNDLFQTLQVYLGSQYVNDFNRFGRTYQVIAQADSSYRDEVSDITNLKTRNSAGAMVPIGSVVRVNQTYGPDPVVRYNGYPAADVQGGADPRHMSSSQAVEGAGLMAQQSLPNGMAFEWTGLTYQQVTQGKAALIVFPLCVLLVFLVLAALYESWSLPLTVILIVPMCMLSAIAGVWLTGGDNNIFVQIGLVVLMGLACKNAILIVEFARELELKEGLTIVDAALKACRQRLRPILMTSFAFIMGVLPLVFAHGAGAEIRHAMGITVFSGMLGVTLFGLFLTPVFYVVIRTLATRRGGGALKRHDVPALEA